MAGGAAIGVALPVLLLHMPPVGQRKRNLVGLLVFVVFACAWFAVAWSYVFPGARNWDSYEHLHQGLTGEYRTTFTIAYAWLLGKSFNLFGTVGGLWVVQLLFLLACYVWLVDRGRARVVVVLVAVVGLLMPPVWAGMVQHWRDTWVAAFCLLAFCGSVARAPVVVVVAAIAAYQFRSNAVLLCLPLLAIAARDLLLPTTRAWMRSTGRRLRAWQQNLIVGAGVVVLVAMCVLTSTVIARALHAIPGFPIGPSLLFDLADMWRREPDTRRPVEMPRRLLRQARHAVTECDSHDIVDGSIPELEVKMLAAQKDALITDWWNAVSKHPVTWLRHRWRAAECMLRIDYAPKPPYRFGYGIITRGNHGRGESDARADPVRLTPIQEKFWAEWAPTFDPKNWLLVFSLASMLALWRARPGGVISAFVVGNLLYLFSNFILAPSPNLRYIFPLLTSTVALAICAAAGPALRRSRLGRRVPAATVAAAPATQPPTAGDDAPSEPPGVTATATAPETVVP